MLHYDFENSLGYWVCITSHAIRRALNAELTREGISFRQWEVLAWIALEGELSQARLADRLGIEAPTLVGILDRMERDGWLDRVPCPQDRRKKRIRASEKAEKAWQRMVDCAHAVRARAVQGITPEELANFKALCTQIRENLGADLDVITEDESPSASTALSELLVRDPMPVLPSR